MAVARPARTPESEGTFLMRSSHSLDAVAVTFDDDHLVANAGLIQPATGPELGLKGLFDNYVDLGSAAEHSNVGDKATTLVHSALAGGDSIDDADVLRAGSSGVVLGHRVAAPLDAGDVPAQLHLGPRPPARPGHRRPARPGVGGWGRPGSRLRRGSQPRLRRCSQLPRRQGSAEGTPRRRPGSDRPVALRPARLAVQTQAPAPNLARAARTVSQAGAETCQPNVADLSYTYIVKRPWIPAWVQQAEIDDGASPGNVASRRAPAERAGA